MKKNSKLIENLEEKLNIVSKRIVNMISQADSGHLTPSLSSVRIIIALYFAKMHHNPKDPKWKERDRFILSKGHAAPALYAILAEAGYFPIKELSRLRKLGSFLQGHPDTRIPGVEIPTGSLGQGLSIGNGIALAAKLDNKSHHIYVLLGDGECDEGQVWEAAMTTTHYKLNNITAIIDRNYTQFDGPTENIKRKEPLANKWRSFGWKVIEINGHDFSEILDGLDEAYLTKNKPTVIISHMKDFDNK